MITLAFYKGTRQANPQAHLFDRLVCWWPRSRGEFSHVELVTSWSGPQALCWSASGRDGGVRGKRIDLASGRWVLVDLPGFELARAEEWFKAHDGAPYDYPGVLGFVITLVKQVAGWLFCSEAVAAALQHAAVAVAGPPSTNVPPSHLYAWAIAQPGATVRALFPTNTTA